MDSGGQAFRWNPMNISNQSKRRLHTRKVSTPTPTYSTLQPPQKTEIGSKYREVRTTKQIIQGLPEEGCPQPKDSAQKRALDNESEALGSNPEHTNFSAVLTGTPVTSPSPPKRGWNINRWPVHSPRVPRRSSWITRCSGTEKLFSTEARHLVPGALRRSQRSHYCSLALEGQQGPLCSPWFGFASPGSSTCFLCHPRVARTRGSGPRPKAVTAAAPTSLMASAEVA